MKSRKTPPKIRLSKKKLVMYVKIILITLKQTMRDCETYEEFKECINSTLKEALDDDK